MISFTEKGRLLSQGLYQAASNEMDITLYTKHKQENYCMYPSPKTMNEMAETGGDVVWVEECLTAWTRQQFLQQQAMVFIGACGIAVRAIAPCLKNKLEDPPVLVMDEGGGFIIPLLSGHYGGANELAEGLAALLGAVAVITTATDVNHLFAVDVFARRNDLVIRNRDKIVRVASAILAGERVTIAMECEWTGEIPKELTLITPFREKVSILVSVHETEQGMAELQLCPKSHVIGIGCKSGKTLEELEDAVLQQIRSYSICMESVFALASIDRKKEEEGLVRLAQKLRVPFLTYDNEALNRVSGEFSSSDFVKEQMGVDNVCERAAMAACGGNGTLLVRKQAQNGITVAIAERKRSVVFYET